MRRLLVLIATIVVAACKTPTPAPIAVPADAGAVVLDAYPAEETFVIPVYFNGRGPYEVLLDTGATVSAIFENVAPSLELDAADGATEDALVRGLITSERRPIVRLRTLQIGNRTHSDVRVVVLPRSRLGGEIDGIVGMDILRDYALGYDAERHAVTLVPGDRFSATWFERWDRMPLNQNPFKGRDFGLHFGEGHFSGKTVPVLIDTGTTPSVINWEAATYSRAVRMLREELRRGWELEGSVGTFVPKARAVMPTILLGTHRWLLPKLLILDLKPLDVIGAGGQPLIIVGADVLARRSFMIDFAGDQMFISPNVLPEDAVLPASRPRGAADPDLYE